MKLTLIMRIISLQPKVATDLSAAFDTIDNDKLLDKPAFQGIQGSELAIFKSFLSERSQYVVC